MQYDNAICCMQYDDNAQDKDAEENINKENKYTDL